MDGVRAAVRGWGLYMQDVGLRGVRDTIANALQASYSTVGQQPAARAKRLDCAAQCSAVHPLRMVVVLCCRDSRQLTAEGIA